MPDVGDNLGRYTLLRRLAAGGMGEVYVAAKPGPVGFGPYVALKVLREELAVDQQFVDMLVDEANISMFLNHQNVVAVLDLSEDSGRYYIAMEFVQGITVERLVDSRAQSGKKPDIPASLYIATELCRALKYAHTRVNHAGEPLNIVHRDVTPANILVSTQGEVKLTDFGIARAKGRVHQTQAGVLKGKFGYMAPEMVRYERIDARADIFCAGVCVYLMISGRHPVAGAAVMEAIQMYEEGRIPPPKQFNPDISDNLNTIIMKALEPKVENRWASAAAFGDALQDVTLQNPAWRRGVQDGARLVKEMIREVAPEAFKEPVEKKALDELLAKQKKKDVSKPTLVPRGPPKREEPKREEPRDPASNSQQITITPTGGRSTSGMEDTADVDGDTADRLPAISPDMDFSPTPSAVDPDFETDESNPVPRNVAFPESSTDRHRIRESMMDEPALPAGAREESGGEDRTVAGYDFGADGTESAPRVSDIDDMDDGATATGVGDDDEDFGAPTLAMSAVSVEEEPLPPGIDVSEPALDDGKTLAGVALADKWKDGSVDIAMPSVSDGGDEDYDAATMIPSSMHGLGVADDWEGGATEADGQRGADATLLDGINADDVQAAMTARRQVPKTALVRDESGEDLPAGRLDAAYEELIREGTGETRPKDPAADPADRPSERSDPKLFSGPLRIVMGNDGPALAKGEPAKREEVKSAADALAAAASSPGAFKPASEKKRPPPAEPKKSLGAAVPQPAQNLEVGQETGKWMAGKLDGNALDWSDEAAARRAVAARAHQPAPVQPPVVHHAPQPAFTPPGYPQPHAQPPLPYPPPMPHVAPPSFLKRNWMVVGTLGVAVALFGTLIYLWALTSTFWPKLKLDSNPQGASVTIDGSTVAGKTPLTVRVEPEKRHLVEFQMEHKKRVLREITEDVGRGRTYSLTVELEAQPPRFDIINAVDGTLYINDAEAGRGRSFVLTDLPQSGSIRIRIEAPGYHPYDQTFKSIADVPPAMDIPLNKIQ
jgi:serine/threonine protein kinase